MSKAYMESVADEAPIVSARNVALPRKSYLLRCVNCEFKRSKVKPDPKDASKTVGNNPMLERTWEIVSPSTVRILDVAKTQATGEKVYNEVIVEGIQVRDWMTMTAKTANIVKADSTRLGVELPDDEQPDVAAYVGKTANAILKTVVTRAKDEETGEPIQLPDGSIKDDYQHQLQEWLG